jgi:hypothetical protein
MSMPDSAPGQGSGRSRSPRYNGVGKRCQTGRQASPLFFMVYRAKAMLPTDLQYGSPRVQTYQSDTAEEAQKDTIDLLKESRDTVIIRSVGYQ